MGADRGGGRAFLCTVSPAHVYRYREGIHKRRASCRRRDRGRHRRRCCVGICRYLFVSLSQADWRCWRGTGSKTHYHCADSARRRYSRRITQGKVLTGKGLSVVLEDIYNSSEALRRARVLGVIGWCACCVFAADSTDAAVKLPPGDGVEEEAAAHVDAPEIELEEVPATAARAEDSASIAPAGSMAAIVAEDTTVVVEDELPPIERMPEIVKRVDARYPPEIYGRGIQGAVLLDVVVSDSGTVDSVAVVRGVHPVLDKSAADALRQFEFTPAISEGEPIPVLIQYEYAFTLQEIVERVEKYVNFSGRLVERGTRSPIADAMVVVSFVDTVSDTSLPVPFSAYRERLGQFEGQGLEEDRLVTITDSLGAFRFYSLPACTIEVAVPATGYEEFREREVIMPSQETMVTYRLNRVSYSDYEIVVYGKKEKKEVSRRQLTLHEVKKVPGLGGDAVKVVQALPGVARPTFGSSQIVVRGASTGDSRFFLDGVEIPLLFHFGGIKSTYNSDALEAVDFYPGGWGSRYGGAVAGIIEVTGRRPKTDRWHGYADANFLDGALFVEGPVSKNKKVSMLGEVRRSFIGDLIKFGVSRNPQVFVLTTAPYYWDYILRTDIDITENQHVYVTGFGVKDGLELITSEIRGGSSEISDAKDAFNVEILFHMGLLGWDWKVTDAVTNALRLSTTRAQSEVAGGGAFRSTENLWMHYLRDQVSVKPGDQFQVNVGADAQVMPYNMELVLIDATNEINADTTDNWVFGVIGGYLNLEWRPVEQLLIIPGIRYDFFPELDYRGANVPEFWDYGFMENETRFSGEPSFRLTCRYEVIPDHTLKLATGNYSQTPEPMGQSIHPDWGDPALSATRASHYVLGHEWQATDLVHTDVQGYYNMQWKVARYADSTDLAGGSRLFLDNGKRRMYGLEFMLRHDQSERFFGWLAYSLSRSEYFDYQEDDWALYSKDQTHNVIAVGSWRLPRNWEAGFKLQYTTGDPQTPVIGSVYREHLHFFDREEGEARSTRLPPTFQLDLRIDKKFVFEKWMFTAYVDFFNINYFLYKSPQLAIFNSAEPYDYETGTENKRYAYQYSIPSIGLKAEF
ncbi:MAG: TonB family protein [Chitinivibrionales bacterium]|nr:TonB family protein [Chitinivibrionales bacterium]MBD3395472.1 TonB family protein [Chitinivibrionales bacterium]